MKKFTQILQNVRPLNKLIDVSKNFSIPGFEGISIFDVSNFFISRLKEGEIQTRARSMAFSFLLALFPAVIFIFTLIPYIPIENFQERMLALIQALMPSSTYNAARDTIEDIVKHQRGGLLSFGFLFALFISADGILALIRWFNKSYHGKESRSFWKLRGMAIGITITLAFFVTLSIGLIVSSELLYNYLIEKELLTSRFQLIILQFIKWIILLGLCFSAISLLYYLGPARSEKLKFISAGSSLATLLIVLSSLGFNFFIVNFGQYNKLYGSIGTLIIILVWLYINSLVLLMGYELNVSIRKAKGKITLLPTR